MVHIESTAGSKTGVPVRVIASSSRRNVRDVWWREVRCSLEIVSESIELVDQEVDVLLLHSGIGDNVAEEVGNVAERLVADH